MSSQPMIDCVVISIATFRRPNLLSSLLSECLRQAAEVAASVRIIVVDNDPENSARETVKGFAQVEYLTEPTPGIAAARNRGLDALKSSDGAVIFIDDDELPGARWLDSLLGYANATGADIVTGPVEPLIDESVPRWILEGGFWRREDRETGSVPGSVATNNTLLRLSSWRPGAVRFSQELSMKGGSDTEFFRSLRAGSGLVVLWCADAIVREHILPERANARWLFRRAVRIGNINARYQGRASALLGGVARVVVGAPYIAMDYAARRQPMARSWNMLAHGVGMIGNVLSMDVVEYRRSRSEK